MLQALRHICGELLFVDNEGKYHHRFDRDGQLPPMTFCPLCKIKITENSFRAVYRIEPMSREMMEYTITSGKACSNCWGYGMTVKDVYMEDEENPELLHHFYRVLCVNCKEETLGFVTTEFVAFCRRIDFENAGLAYKTLADYIEGDHPFKRRKEQTEESRLHDLGF